MINDAQKWKPKKAALTMKRCFNAGLAIGMEKSELMAVILEALEDQNAQKVEDIAREIDADAVAEALSN